MTTTSRPLATPAATGLSIGALSRVTGVSVATLRTWELRYEFPVPQRLPSGHRRYDHSSVDAIAAITRQREAGVALAAAIAEARDPGRHDESIYDEVRRHHPDLAFQQIHGRTLDAVARALEDECCARAQLPVLFGGFQRRSAYEPLRDRWTDLARTARATYVLADFAGPGAAGEPVQVCLRPGSRLLRERFLVCDGPDQPALVVATELPGQAGLPVEERVYDAFWTVEPAVVRTAGRVCAAVSFAAGAPDAEQLMHRLAPPATHATDPGQPVRLFNRIVTYLDQSSRGERR